MLQSARGSNIFAQVTLKEYYSDQSREMDRRRHGHLNDFQKGRHEPLTNFDTEYLDSQEWSDHYMERLREGAGEPKVNPDPKVCTQLKKC